VPLKLEPAKIVHEPHEEDTTVAVLGVNFKLFIFSKQFDEL
jgi:hypothetical protein